MQTRKVKIPKLLTAAMLLVWALFLGGCAEKRAQIVWEREAVQEPADESGAGIPTDGASEKEDDAQPQEIVVDVCGAVQNPGVYRLQEGARVCDAIALAGGLREDADIEALNQAQRLLDSDKIRVYSRAETAAMTSGQLVQTAPENGGSEKIDLNSADIAGLCTLSGIGQSRAKDIIAYREANGGFRSIEEIMNVSGIKEATFQKIKEDIVVR